MSGRGKGRFQPFDAAARKEVANHVPPEQGIDTGIDEWDRMYADFYRSRTLRRRLLSPRGGKAAAERKEEEEEEEEEAMALEVAYLQRLGVSVDIDAGEPSDRSSDSSAPSGECQQPQSPRRPPPTRALLERLLEAHVSRVPYETLDIHTAALLLPPASLPSKEAAAAAAPPALDELSCVRRVAVEGKGGYCFLLATPFAWLLRRLGFRVALAISAVTSREDHSGRLDNNNNNNNQFRRAGNLFGGLPSSPPPTVPPPSNLETLGNEGVPPFQPPREKWGNHCAVLVDLRGSSAAEEKGGAEGRGHSSGGVVVADVGLGDGPTGLMPVTLEQSDNDNQQQQTQRARGFGGGGFGGSGFDGDFGGGGGGGGGGSFGAPNGRGGTRRSWMEHGWRYARYTQNPTPNKGAKGGAAAEGGDQSSSSSLSVLPTSLPTTMALAPQPDERGGRGEEVPWVATWGFVADPRCSSFPHFSLDTVHVVWRGGNPSAAKPLEAEKPSEKALLEEKLLEENLRESFQEHHHWYWTDPSSPYVKGGVIFWRRIGRDEEREWRQSSSSTSASMTSLPPSPPSASPLHLLGIDAKDMPFHGGVLLLQGLELYVVHPSLQGGGAGGSTFGGGFDFTAPFGGGSGKGGTFSGGTFGGKGGKGGKGIPFGGGSSRALETPQALVARGSGQVRNGRWCIRVIADREEWFRVAEELFHASGHVLRHGLAEEAKIQLWGRLQAQHATAALASAVAAAKRQAATLVGSSGEQHPLAGMLGGATSVVAAAPNPLESIAPPLREAIDKAEKGEAAVEAALVEEAKEVLKALPLMLSTRTQSP